MKFRIEAGKYAQNGITYLGTKKEVFETNENLAARWPNRFTRVADDTPVTEKEARIPQGPVIVKKKPAAPVVPVSTPAAT